MSVRVDVLGSDAIPGGLRVSCYLPTADLFLDVDCVTSDPLPFAWHFRPGPELSEDLQRALQPYFAELLKRIEAGERRERPR